MKAGFRDLLDRICEKALTVRAIVLTVVDTQDLDPNTVRSLGMLIPPGRQRFASNCGRLAEIAGILATLDGLQ